MKLSAPSKGIFYVATILAIIAIVVVVLAKVGIAMPAFLVVNAFWILTVGFILLVLGVCLTGI